MPKMQKISISLSETQYAKALAEAVSSHGGNMSQYFQKLIDQSSTGSHADVVLELARKFAPVRVAELAAVFDVAPWRQDVIVARFIEALALALRRDMNPETPFTLLGPKEHAAHVLAGNPPVMAVLKDLADIIEEHMQAVADGQVPASKTKPAKPRRGAGGKSADAPGTAAARTLLAREESGDAVTA